MKNENTIKYFLYARKSSESEDRQVQSIDDQINRLKGLASDLNLNVVKIYTEAKSAKKPDNRPLFDEMINKIEKGEANGILCWQINRLSRNPIDSGKISWILQQGILKSIQTIDRQYLPDDNVLLFNVESGMANQYILDLKKNVKRGLESKVAKGWLPNLAPLGYINDKGNKTIIKDPERFNLVRKIWDLMLTGNYTPPKILSIANKEWGFTTRKFKRIGGKELSKSGIYRMLTNIFYAGIIDYNDRQYKGNHGPMITLEEYDRVQILLGRKGRPRPKTHQFAFTGLIRCKVCGCLYTAETKTKFIKNTGKIKEYTYYHCTRKKKDINCTQRKTINLENLEAQIEKEIDKCAILPEFLHWALEILNENNAKIEDKTQIAEMQRNTLTQTENELKELTKMRYRLLIDDETFIKEQKELKNKITQLKNILETTEDKTNRLLELTERTFNFATYAHIQFIEGRLELKKEILMGLGKNPIIEHENIVIEPYEWLKPIQKGYPSLKEEYLMLEPANLLENEYKTEALSSIRSRWRRGWDSNPQAAVKQRRLATCWNNHYPTSPSNLILPLKSPQVKLIFKGFYGKLN